MGGKQPGAICKAYDRDLEGQEEARGRTASETLATGTTIACEVCGGNGEHSESHPFPDDPYYEIVTPCPNCKGKGQVEIDERLPPNINFCTSCKRHFRDGDTCPRGGCPMGGDF